MAVFEAVYAESMHSIAVILACVSITISVIVAPNPMFYARLEISDVATPIGAVLTTSAVTLSIKPLTGVAIPAVKLEHTESMSEPLPIHPTVSATFGPILYSIPIIPPVDPIAFVPSISKVTVYSTPTWLPFVKLPLVAVSIVVILHSLRTHAVAASLIPFPLAAVSDEPLDRPDARGGLGGDEFEELGSVGEDADDEDDA